MPRRGKDDETEVSWRLIRRGMPVVDRSGELLGHVTRLLGDPHRDIFSGVAFRRGLFGPELTADLSQVGLITEAAVHLLVAGEDPGAPGTGRLDGKGNGAGGRGPS